jgi:hypothetical protein
MSDYYVLLLSLLSLLDPAFHGGSVSRGSSKTGRMRSCASLLLLTVHVRCVFAQTDLRYRPMRPRRADREADIRWPSAFSRTAEACAVGHLPSSMTRSVAHARALCGVCVPLSDPVTAPLQAAELALAQSGQTASFFSSCEVSSLAYVWALLPLNRMFAFI